MRRCDVCLIPVLLVLTVFGACSDPGSPQQPYLEALPAIDVPWRSGQSVVCFGTSLTYGFIWSLPAATNGLDVAHGLYPSEGDAAPPSYAYPALLGATLRIPVYNQGYLGATTARALQLVRDSVLSRAPALVLLEFGANDFLQHVPDSVAEPQLLRLVDTLQAAGSKVILISFLNPEMIATIPVGHYLASRKGEASAYLAMLRRVGAARGILFVEYAMRGIYWNASMMSDPLHPNRDGYRKMQENISNALVLTFRKNGMLL
jgi:acyl-CoA thioesterase I